jgi:hypothetical protein
MKIIIMQFPLAFRYQPPTQIRPRCLFKFLDAFNLCSYLCDRNAALCQSNTTGNITVSRTFIVCNTVVLCIFRSVFSILRFQITEGKMKGLPGSVMYQVIINVQILLPETPQSFTVSN